MKQLTLEDIIELAIANAAQRGKGWEVQPNNGRIRCTDGKCVNEEAAGVIPGWVTTAVDQLEAKGATSQDLLDILLASDNLHHHSKRVRDVRAKLLRMLELAPASTMS